MRWDAEYQGPQKRCLCNRIGNALRLAPKNPGGFAYSGPSETLRSSALRLVACWRRGNTGRSTVAIGKILSCSSVSWLAQKRERYPGNAEAPFDLGKKPAPYTGRNPDRLSSVGGTQEGIQCATGQGARLCQIPIATCWRRRSPPYPRPIASRLIHRTVE